MNTEQPVSSVMTTRLVTVAPDDRLTKIRAIFETNSFHHIPVLDRGELVGIVSKTDFLRISHTLSFTWDGKEHINGDRRILTAYHIMTKYPMRLDPDDTISLAADIFLANKFHALPVVDGEALVGIVTVHDLLSHAYGSRVSESAMVEDFNDL